MDGTTETQNHGRTKSHLRWVPHLTITRILIIQASIGMKRGLVSTGIEVLATLDQGVGMIILKSLHVSTRISAESTNVLSIILIGN